MGLILLEDARQRAIQDGREVGDDSPLPKELTSRFHSDPAKVAWRRKKLLGMRGGHASRR